MDLHPNQPDLNTLKDLEKQKQKAKNVSLQTKDLDNDIIVKLQANNNTKLYVLNELESHKQKSLEDLRQNPEQNIEIDEAKEASKLEYQRLARKKEAFKKRRNQGRTYLKLNDGVANFLIKQQD